MVLNLEFGRRRHAGQLFALPETFQGITIFQRGRRCKGRWLIIFDNCIKNQPEKLLNMSDMYGVIFQGDGATIKDTPLLGILAGGGLPTSVSPKYFGIYR